VSSPLSSPRLRRIIAAYTVNRMGTWFGLLALVIAVYEHTHSALAVAALLFAGQAVPAFAVPAIVARVEASPGHSKLAALYVFEAVVTAALAVLLWSFWLPAVLALVMLDGMAALAANALLRAEVARAAREEMLASGAGDDARHEAERKANAALNLGFSTTFVVGPALAGVVVAAAGASTALFIDVGSFAACAALVLDLHPHVETASEDSVRERLRSAWRHISDTPSLRALLLAEAIAFVFIETGAPIEVPFVKMTLHAGDRGLGLILTMWGVGAVLGSIGFARLIKRPLGEMLGAGTLAIAVAYFGLAAARSLELACVAALVGGIGNGLQWPSMISIVQRVTPEHLHGRMMGAVESLGAIPLAIGLPLGGLLVACSSPRTAFAIVGAGALAMTIVLLRLTRRSLGTAAPADDGEARTLAKAGADVLPES
jgi:MFS family permease